jgi:hypothetical protein
VKNLRHLLAVAGVAVAGTGAGARWWEAELSTGARVVVGGTEASALVWSVGAVVLASYGVQFAVRGLFRRGTALLQACGGAAFAGLAILASQAPLSSVLPGVTSVTGVAGGKAAELVETVTLTGWHYSAVIAGILLALSGIIAAFQGEGPTSPNRFERQALSESLEDSVSTWDSLSDGSDPTRP